MVQQAASPFSDPAYKTNPYDVYAEWRRRTPVYKTILPGGSEVYLVMRYEDVMACLRDSRLVKNVRNARPARFLDRILPDLASSNMLRADPPDHTRLRKLANEAFKPKYINQMRPGIEQMANDLIDKVQGAGKMDAIADYAFPLPVTVISEMLGVPAEDHVRFSRWSKELIASGALSGEGNRLQGATLQLTNYMRNLVNEHKKHPKDDLISQLIDAEDNGDKLSNFELIGTTVLLLIAGHETTVNLIGNGLLALLQHADQLETLKRDPALINGAVEELLRYVNPVQLVNRYAAEDIEISGTHLPRGSHLMLMLASANHDPAYRANPDALDISEGEARHMAFSQGIHYCLGAPLARLEGQIAFATLLKRLPTIHLAVPAEQLRWRPAFELRGLETLPVEF